ncbi:MAG: helix-turn-helix domain-containing protein [Acidobacteriia bacterium]|nr:helix-turn-helix domain-containing protein [Terriglobia bacterium]
MDRAGEKLKRVRERLKLTYRDVEQASQDLARRHANAEFLVPLSRLADIENSGKVPSVFRLYTLCAIYRLDLQDVMRWYGVPAEQLATEAFRIGLDETHPFQINLNRSGVGADPTENDFDLSKTTFLSQLIRQWGRVPFNYLNGLDLRNRYGLVGLEDWSMYPILRPGSLVLIDENRRKIARGGWTDEHDRPIYFLEHRGGFACGWCSIEGDRLLIQPHPASEKQPSLFRFPEEIDVVGQVIGVAMRLESNQRRLARPSGTTAKPVPPER